MDLLSFATLNICRGSITGQPELEVDFLTSASILATIQPERPMLSFWRIETEIVLVVFGLFKSEPYQDPEFGEFARSHGHWSGEIELAPIGTFNLSLAGDRNAPHPNALQLLRELRERVPSLVPRIEHGLFEHYLPYKQAVEAGIEMNNPFPQLAETVEVWPHVKAAHVLIEPVDVQWTVEIAFTTDWDIEHTVAAIYADWQFIEFNGSVRGI